MKEKKQNMKEKIKSEIKRLIKAYSPIQSAEGKYKVEAYEDLLTFIDSLKEEPVSNDLEEACDEYYNETWDEHGGKAMVVDGYHDIWFPSQATDDFFKAGAQWQKEQMIDKTCEWLKSYRQDTPDGTGYIPGIINDETIEDFKKAMEK